MHTRVKFENQKEETVRKNVDLIRLGPVTGSCTHPEASLENCRARGVAVNANPSGIPVLGLQ